MFEKIKLPSIKQIVPNLLILPTISHWILPAGYEESMYFSLFGVPFYSFNICYLIYIILYKYYIDNEEIIFSRIWVRRMSFAFFCVIFIASLLNYAEPILPILLNSYSLFWIAPLMCFFPLTSKNIINTKYLLIFTLFFLCGEILLYATGILTYKSVSTNVVLSGQIYDGGIMRISTTIGAATGTAVILVWLSAFCISYFELNKYKKLAIILVSTISIFYTVSRGAIIVWVLFLLVFFYKNYLQYNSLIKKLYFLIIFISIITSLSYYSVFDPIIDRNKQLENSSSLVTGREKHLDKSLKIIKESHYLGAGAAMMFPEKSIQKVVVAQKKEASHNVYLIVAGETGLLGLFFFISIFIIMYINIREEHLLIKILVLLSMIVNFNTEGVILMSEFSTFFLFILLSVQKAKYIYE